MSTAYTVRDSATMLRRNLLHIRRYPSLSIMLVAQPVRDRAGHQRQAQERGRAARHPRGPSPHARGDGVAERQGQERGPAVGRVSVVDAGQGRADHAEPDRRGQDSGQLGDGTTTPRTAAGQIGTVLDNTGLPGGAQQIVCVGPAVPIPAWSVLNRYSVCIPTNQPRNDTVMNRPIFTFVTGTPTARALFASPPTA